MRLSENFSRIGAAVLFGLFVAAGSLEPIRSFDYFWHLATGRWIVEHRSLPLNDPFTLASHDHVWINLEWLFQSFLYLTFEVIGHTGLTVLLALLVAAGAAALFLYARARTETGPALLLCAVAWVGAAHRIDVRAETAAIPFLVLFLIILMRPPTGRLIGASFLLTVVWFAVHPSALLAPLMAGLVLAGSLFERNETRPQNLYRLAQIFAAGAALLVNPWGLSGVLAPVKLATLLRREGLVNLEWLPSSPRVFPELYVIVIVSIILVLIRNKSPLRWSRFLLLLLFSALAIRYVRNHAFFYPVLPVLLAPSIGTVTHGWNRALLLLSALVIGAGFSRQEPGLGVDIDKFPVRSAERIHASGLQGNVYTPDQFGGYLVWSFYPERRALVDGRNELYVEFFRRFAEARVDSRAWRKLFDDFELALAVEEYRPSYVEMIDGITGERRRVPASEVLFPRSEWALIGFDESSMLFAKRDAHPEPIIRALELRSIVPDARRAVDATRGSRIEALEDLRRLEARAGVFPRMERLRYWLQAGVERSVDDAVAIE